MALDLTLSKYLKVSHLRGVTLCYVAEQAGLSCQSVKKSGGCGLFQRTAASDQQLAADYTVSGGLPRSSAATASWPSSFDLLPELPQVTLEGVKGGNAAG